MESVKYTVRPMDFYGVLKRSVPRNGKAYVDSQTPEEAALQREGVFGETAVGF